MISASDRRDLLFPLAFFHWQIVLGLVFAVIAGVAAASLARHRDRRTPALHGLLAAIVAAAPMSLLIVGIGSVAGCVNALAVVVRERPRCPGSIEPSFVWQQTRRLVDVAAVMALLAGSASAGLVSFWSGRRRRITS